MRRAFQSVADRDSFVSAVLAAVLALDPHTSDADCRPFIGADGCCGVCGVEHGEPCEWCGGRGFHTSEFCGRGRLHGAEVGDPDWSLELEWRQNPGMLWIDREVDGHRYFKTRDGWVAFPRLADGSLDVLGGVDVNAGTWVADFWDRYPDAAERRARLVRELESAARDMRKAEGC